MRLSKSPVTVGLSPDDITRLVELALSAGVSRSVVVAALLRVAVSWPELMRAIEEVRQ